MPETEYPDQNYELQRNNVQPETTQAKGPAIKHGWLRAVLFLIVALISQMLAAVIGLFSILLATNADTAQFFGSSENMMNQLDAGEFLVVSIFQFGGMMLALWIFRRFIDRKSLTSLGFQFKAYVNDFIAGMGWGVGLISIGFFVLSVSGILTIEKIHFDGVALLLLFLTFSVVALNEEIMFRGYLLTNLSASMNKYIALVLTAILFSILHMTNPNVSVLSAINIFLAGILLGIYFVHKQNLWFPIGMHLTWNFFQGPIYGFEVSGIQKSGLIAHALEGHELITGGEFGLEGSLITTFAMLVMIVIIHFRHRQ